MAATTWRPRETTPRSWLLANGAVATTPPIEQTSTGRKVRVAGTEHTAYTKDAGDLIWAAIEREARRRNTTVWMPVYDRHRTRDTSAWPTDRKPELHFAKPGFNGSWRGETVLWWRFRHPVLPIEATVRVTMTGNSRYDTEDSSQSVSGEVLLPSTDPSHARHGKQYSIVNSLAALTANMSREQATAVSSVTGALPKAWGISEALSVKVTFPTVRAGVKELLRRVRAVEEIDRLQIPDLHKAGLLRLELVDSNVTGEFVQSLVSFLDSEPAVERALAAYQDFRTALRQVGLVLDDTNTDSLLAALQSGSDAIQVPLGSAAAPDGHDKDHKLTVRLATGTFVVACHHRAKEATADQNVVADRWQESLAIASITGKEDELLAYARAFVLQSEEVRAKDVLANHV